MSDFKGTKGNWVNGWGNGLTGPTTPTLPNPTVDNDRKYTPISKGEETIAIVIQQVNDSIEELEANAKLIAASPDLLKAGIAALKLLEEMNHHKIDFVRGSLRNAIEKATGQESQ